MKRTLKCAAVVTLIFAGLLLAACGAEKIETKNVPLPLPEIDEGAAFGVDKNINQNTIDEWLGRDDVAYRDVRMLFDPARFDEIGGEADLDKTIEGFKVVPYPYLATLQSMPVSQAYDGDKLFDVVWTDDGHVKTAEPVYQESMMILEELFPKDKAIFLMCGGGGYANMTRELLVSLGWDETKVYNIGANWEYKGAHAVELIVYPEEKDDNKIYASWRADYAYIEFSRLNKLVKM